jgi:hypothetical protein
MTRVAVPPYLRVYGEFKRRIEARELGPGEQVPSATQLAEEFSVSRSTARRVLALLKNRDTPMPAPDGARSSGTGGETRPSDTRALACGVPAGRVFGYVTAACMKRGAETRAGGRVVRMQRRWGPGPADMSAFRSRRRVRLVGWNACGGMGIEYLMRESGGVAVVPAGCFAAGHDQYSAIHPDQQDHSRPAPGPVCCPRTRRARLQPLKNWSERRSPAPSRTRRTAASWRFRCPSFPDRDFLLFTCLSPFRWFADNLSRAGIFELLAAAVRFVTFLHKYDLSWRP